MNIRPIGKRIMIKEIRREEKTSSGIILPDSIQEGPQMGLVLAIGSKLQEPELQVEDVILFYSNSGIKINVNNEDYLIVEENDILAFTKNN